MDDHKTRVDLLIRKGVRIPNPIDFFINDDVDTDRICATCTLFPGTRLMGAETYIAEGSRIGFEAPATVENCYVGPGVSLKGGFFSGAVFLSNASCGLGSHVRAGTILEEQASIAHTVGLKQTILFPFVTLGSLINFCDCLMSGGTSNQNHSEVGSSYIHFNYTPNQDKATPSLLGDVPRGVMLNQSPIFLGGQGGLVGPCRLNYGTVVAAGTICRHDQSKENHLVFGGSARRGSMPYKPGGFPNIKRILNHNINYLANLSALGQWYKHVRSMFIGPDLPEPIFKGLTKILTIAVEERIKQLERLIRIINQKSQDHDGIEKDICSHWDQMKVVFETLLEFQGDTDTRDRFLQILQSPSKDHQNSYLDTIAKLNSQESAIGVQWLEGIVEKINCDVLGILPSAGN
jgi:UDP-N-acetylglucosamine/UDP-N-acetylgalactosamine diphosphorylase